MNLSHQLPLIRSHHHLALHQSAIPSISLPPPPLLALRSLNSDTHEVINAPTPPSPLSTPPHSHPSFGDSLSSTEPHQIPR